MSESKTKSRQDDIDREFNGTDILEEVMKGVRGE